METPIKITEIKENQTKYKQQYDRLHNDSACKQMNTDRTNILIWMGLKIQSETH